MTVLDRSWYGRVLVERIEGFAGKREWRRAYDQIVGFERSLCVEGMVLVKLWLHISDEEQLRRFNARAHDPLKRWKLTDEDWRNRKRRPEYEPVVAEMLERTDHEHARWTVIASESKPYARVAVLNAVVEQLEHGMRRAGQEPLAVETAL
jgi:polyphosphate kinase 2 (PPK2 family)